MTAKHDTNKISRAAEFEAAREAGKSPAAPPRNQRRKEKKTTSVAGRADRQAAAKEKVTLIRAQIDVGLGNALFIRGQGNGLNWEKGQPLECIAPSTWIWCTSQACETVEFKLLLNDQVWSGGPNVLVEAGRQIDVTPVFGAGAALMP